MAEYLKAALTPHERGSSSMNQPKFIKRLTGVFLAIGTIALIVMATIIALNVLGRSFLGKPILGTLDISGLAGVVFATVAVPFVESQRRNVVMEVVSARFPPRLQAFMNAFVLALGLGACGLVTWAMVKESMRSASFSEATLISRIPVAPFKYIWSVGVALLCIILLRNIVASVIKGLKR
jgi:TRAP-type C4-dicarboxylate transport system permease small subunit